MIKWHVAYHQTPSSLLKGSNYLSVGALVVDVINNVIFVLSFKWEEGWTIELITSIKSIVFNYFKVPLL